MRPTAWVVTSMLGLGLACGGSGGDDGVEPVVPPEPEAPTDGTTPEAPPPEPEVEREPLQALVVTSNRADGPNLLDDDTSTSWTPSGDAAGEGVLMRFEAPRRLSKLTVQTCGDAVPLQLYANGDDLGTSSGSEVSFALPAGDVKTLFLKITEGADACLAEVRVEDATGELALAPPRSLPARVEVSSTLEPEAAYHASYLFDGRPHFAWVEGAKGSGDGESIQLTFRKDTTITAIELLNGYHRSQDHYEKNARVRKLEIEAEGRRVMLDVPEGMVPRKLEFDPPVSTRVLTLTVAAAKKGTTYEDLVISELRFHDRKGPFTVEPMGPNRLDEKLQKQIEGKPLASMVDKAYRQVCGQPRELKLRSDNSFVYYESLEGGDSSSQVVLDGAWVPAKGGIQLFARRHVVESTFAPYGGQEDQESVEVAGGTLEVAPLESLGKDEVVKRLQDWAKGGAADRVECLLDGRKVDPTKIKDVLGDAQIILVEGKAITDLLVHAP